MICKLILIFYKFILILGINIEYAHKICVKYQETFETKKAVHFWKKKGFFFFSHWFFYPLVSNLLLDWNLGFQIQYLYPEDQ